MLSQYLNFNSVVRRIEGPMLHHIIPVPTEVIDQFMPFKGAIRVLCKLGKADEFPCALIPANGAYHIAASKKLLSKAGFAEGQIVEVSIRKDEHNGLALPEELAEVLAQDEEGLNVFEALTPGKKRGLIYYISSSPNIDTRIKRSFYIIDKLKRGG